MADRPVRPGRPRTLPASHPTAKRSAAKIASDYELITRIDNTEGRWMDRIDDLATRVAQHQHYSDERIDTVEDNLGKKIQEHTDTVTRHIDAKVEALSKDMSANVSKLDTRITVLERWRWIIIGGALVVLFIITNYLVQLWAPVP